MPVFIDFRGGEAPPARGASRDRQIQPQQGRGGARPFVGNAERRPGGGDARGGYASQPGYGERPQRPTPARQVSLPRYLALAPRPTEPLLAAELRALPGVTDVVERPGAVAFNGDRAALYRANLWLRCATRVLVPLADVPCEGPEALYDAVSALPWEEHLSATGTLMVSAHGQGPGLNNGVFIAQRVKDAVVDRLRTHRGERPSVDLRQPDLRINVQLYADGAATRCAIALDSSGAPLHQRGYRSGGGLAPLKETLAAAIVSAAGYGVGEPLVPVVDLCCGSGTLLIEAGLRALRRAPGLARDFGFQRWRDFDRAAFAAAKEEARAQALPLPAEPFLFGGDRDAGALRLAEQGVQAAGLLPVTRLTVQALEEAAPPPGPPGIVLVNPPYGERLGDEVELAALYRALGDTLKRRFKGYTAYVFTASLPLSKQIGLRPKSRQVLYNGNLEGRLLRFDLY